MTNGERRKELMSNKGWHRAFDDPIELPDGSALRMLRDAGEFVTALPEKVQHRQEWQTAAEMLMLAAEGKAPLMFAHIGMLWALHAGKSDAPPEPRRKTAKKYRIVR
jgi:hypothetical protein